MHAMVFARLFPLAPAVLAGLLLAPGAAAGREPVWPLRGEVSGELSFSFMPEPGLPWRVEVVAEGLVLHAARPGLKVAVALHPRPEGEWGWEVLAGEVDLAELWPALRGRLGAAAAGWSASGRLVLSGAGTWSPGGMPTGEVRVRLQEGWARSDKLDLELSGIEVELRASDLAGGTLAPGQKLRVGKIVSGGTELTGLSAEFGLREGARVEVARLQVGAFGGQVAVQPFAVNLRRLEVEAVADAEGIALGELAKLSPEAVAGGRGRLGGRVKVGWSPVRGLSVDEGRLTIVKRDEATLRLAPQPGFLTARLPRWLAWASPRLAKDLRAIELGSATLAVDSLEIDFSPESAGESRTARISVRGRPEGKSSVRSVQLEVNVAGDLARVLQMGLRDGVSFSF
jgi:hypothetical protein